MVKFPRLPRRKSRRPVHIVEVGTQVAECGFVLDETWDLTGTADPGPRRPLCRPCHVGLFKKYREAGEYIKSLIEAGDAMAEHIEQEEQARPRLDAVREYLTERVHDDHFRALYATVEDDYDRGQMHRGDDIYRDLIAIVGRGSR